MEEFSVLQPASMPVPRPARTLAQIQAVLDAYTQIFSGSAKDLELAQEWVDELDEACERLDDGAALVIKEALQIYAVQQAPGPSPKTGELLTQETPAMA